MISADIDESRAFVLGPGWRPLGGGETTGVSRTETPSAEDPFLPPVPALDDLFFVMALQPGGFSFILCFLGGKLACSADI